MNVQVQEPLMSDRTKRYVTMTGTRGSKNILMLEAEDAEMLEMAVGLIQHARGVEHIVLSSENVVEVEAS